MSLTHRITHRNSKLMQEVDTFHRVIAQSVS